MNKKDTIFYKTMKPVLVFLMYFLFRPTIIGKNNIPKDKALVLAGNHIKWLDSIMLCAVVGKRQIHFLTKIELFKGPFRIVTKGMGAIPVNHKPHDKSALKTAVDFLKEGLCIGVFPEGEINRTNSVILPFKIGAVKMSQESNATLVPFVITGKYKLFRKNLKIEFLKPLKIDDDLEITNQKLMKVIKDKIRKKKK